MKIDELGKLKLLPGATPLPGETCWECGAPAVAHVHSNPGHRSVCAKHLEPYTSKDVCDCDPTTGKCLHHRRDAAGICLACGPAEAANGERYRRNKERIVMQAKLALERLQWAIQCLEKSECPGSRDDEQGLLRWAAAYAEDAVIILTGGVDEKLNHPPAWFKPPVGAGLERIPTSELYAARTAQLEGMPWPCRTGDESKKLTHETTDQRGEVMGAVPNKIERLKRVALMVNTVTTMKSESVLLPDTVIITIQNDSNTHLKPHIGESWRAQVNQFRSPEHLAEALAEPDFDPDLIEALRAARRDAPDELVIALWDSFGLECFCCSQLTKKSE